jgi:hypothetical protein
MAAPKPGRTSPYAERFINGATLYPRVLVIVASGTPGPLGAGAGRKHVRSVRDNNEKQPWKSLSSLSGTVEKQFIRPTLVGDSVLPFRLRLPQEAIIPWMARVLKEPQANASICIPDFHLGGVKQPSCGKQTKLKAVICPYSAGSIIKET